MVSKSCPVLGASPDAKVIDKGCSICFGLAEVKCPYTKFNVTPLDACSDPDFFMEKVDDKHCRLKRDQDILIQCNQPVNARVIVQTVVLAIFSSFDFPNTLQSHIYSITTRAF